MEVRCQPSHRLPATRFEGWQQAFCPSGDGALGTPRHLLALRLEQGTSALLERLLRGPGDSLELGGLTLNLILDGLQLPDGFLSALIPLIQRSARAIEPVLGILGCIHEGSAYLTKPQIDVFLDVFRGWLRLARSAERR